MAWTHEDVVVKDANGDNAADQSEAANYPDESGLTEGQYFEVSGHAWTSGNGSQADLTADAVSAEADNSSSLEALRAAQAEAEGVQDARHAGYAEVLANYEARTDTEPLADRRARALAVDPADQDFTRKVGYTGNSATKETTRSAD